MVGDAPTGCSSCGGPLAPGQQYCLECGSRTGPRRPELARLKAGAQGAPTAAAGEGGDAGRTVLPAWIPAMRLPSLPICGVLLMVFFGSGIALGAYQRHRADNALAQAAAQQIRILAAGGGKVSTPTPEASTPAETQPAPEKSNPKPAQAPAATAPEKEHGEEETGEQTTPSEKTPGPAPLTKLPPVKHVFLITLSDQPYAKVFGPSSPSPYLSHTLLGQGELLTGYYAVAHNELANLVALVSGQGPTTQTAENCPTYEPVIVKGTGGDEQVLGNGCVYPTATASLPSELEASRLSWRAYVQGTNEGGSTPSGCVHPELGHSDPTSGPSPGSGTYSTFRNPFMYLASVTNASSCAQHMTGLSALGGDLASASRTPNFVYIIPGRCNDGNPNPCTPGASAGGKDSEGLLRRLVPEITGSHAFKENGLLVITVDQAPSSGDSTDSSSCCAQPQFPNLPTS